MAVACAALAPVARADDDASALRAELESLKSDYDARVAALEARIAALESAPPAAVAAAPVEPARARRRRRAAPPRSIPRSRSCSPAATPTPRGIPATGPSPASCRTAAKSVPASAASASASPSSRLRRASIRTSRRKLTAAITGEDEIEVEEAFFRTLRCPRDSRLKGGRFFSGFGYLNEVHAHAWDFADQPLVYQAFFGNQRAQDGVQVKWIAPTDLLRRARRRNRQRRRLPRARGGAAMA